jgi:hypothetical protein
LSRKIYCSPAIAPLFGRPENQSSARRRIPAQHFAPTMAQTTLPLPHDGKNPRSLLAVLQRDQQLFLQRKA